MSITFSNPSEEEDASVKLMHNNLLNDKKGVGLPEVYVVGTSTKPKTRNKKSTRKILYTCRRKNRITDRNPLQ